MTRDELNNYVWLKRETEQQEKRLRRLQHRKPKGVVGDTVKDYRNGKGIPTKIEGVAEEDRLVPLEIAELTIIIEENNKTLRKQLKRIEQFIQTIKDPKVRVLMRCKYIDCMSWKKVGEINHMDPSNVRKIIREFFRAKK